jgi:hypothetical protein
VNSSSWLQATVMLDQALQSIDGLVEATLQTAEQLAGGALRLHDDNSTSLVRLLGDEGQMLAIAQITDLPDPASLHVPLSSTITGMICADMPERIAATQAQLRITVSRGETGQGDPGTEAKIHSLDLLGRITALACQQEGALAVHWKQSEQLLPPQAFLDLVEEGVPGALHMHPFLFGDSGLVGIRTYGARHFIGREMLLQPHAANFAGHFDAMLAVLRFAMEPDGYLIPDGDTFELPGGGFDYQVLYRDREDDGVPLLELRPLDAQA